MSGKINVGIIGLGYWGPNLVRVFNELENASIKACVDLVDSRLEKIKSQYGGINTSKDIDVLLKDPEIDAIIITSSAKTHYELAKKVISAGKHVYVEKPLALNAAEAEELVKLARDSDKVLMVGHLMQYHPGINKIKSYLKNGSLGEVLYLYAQRLNLGKVRKDENCLWSLAPHDISVILDLLEQEPRSITAIGQAYLQKNVEDVVFLTMSFADKVMANIHISWLDPHKARNLTIVGTKKMIVFDDMESSEKVKIFDKGVGPPADYRSYSEDLDIRFGEISVPSIKSTEPLKLECEHFIDCILNDRNPISSGEDGLRVVKVLEAAQRSMDEGGQPVNV